MDLSRGGAKCVGERPVESRPGRGNDTSIRAITRSLLALAAFLLIFASAARSASASAPEGIHKIQHVVMIMQENRSFDTYFGTYPGANGIPAGVCLPDPEGGCVAPFHDSADKNAGGPHGTERPWRTSTGGDGRVRQAGGGEVPAAAKREAAATATASPNAVAT